MERFITFCKLTQITIVFILFHIDPAVSFLKGLNLTTVLLNKPLISDL